MREEGLGANLLYMQDLRTTGLKPGADYSMTCAGFQPGRARA